MLGCAQEGHCGLPIKIQGTVRTVAESAEKRRGRTAIRGIAARSIRAGASRISRIPAESAALSTPQRDLTLVLKIPKTAVLQSGCNTAAGSFSALEGWHSTVQLVNVG